MFSSCWKQRIDIHPERPNTLLATSTFEQQQLWVSHDFGTNWQPLDLSFSADEVIRVEVAISEADPSRWFAVAVASSGGLFGVYRFDDAGVSWIQTASPDTGPNIMGRLIGNPDIFPSDAGGQEEFNLALLPDPIDPEKIYVGSVNLWGSTDGGETFDMVSFILSSFGPSMHQDIHTIRYNPLDQAYYVCSDGGIDRTPSLEVSELTSKFFDCVDPITSELQEDCYRLPTIWEHLSYDMAITEFYRLGLYEADSTLVMAGAQDDSIFIRESSGWVNTFDGDGMECLIDPNNPDVL